MTHNTVSDVDHEERNTAMTQQAQAHRIAQLERELWSYERLPTLTAGDEREKADRVAALRRELERARDGKLTGNQ